MLPRKASPKYDRLPTTTTTLDRKQSVSWWPQRKVCLVRVLIVTLVLCLGLCVAAVVADLFYVIHLEGAFVSWEGTEARKASLPKDARYANITAAELAARLPIWVVSLARATERRQQVLARLAEVAVPHSSVTLIDAVDGRNASAVHPEELAKYLDEGRQKLWHEGQKYVRDKFAVDMSHFRLLQRVLETGELGIIMEDDVMFPPGSDLYEGLAAAMRELPSDWEILYLGACHPTVGGAIGEHLAVARSAVCTWGYIPRPSFAAAVLDGAQRFPQRGKHVDLQYNNLIKRRMVAAYICEPQVLTTLDDRHFSTLEYDARGKAEFYDDPKGRQRL